MRKRIVSSLLVLLVLSTISACGAKTQKTEYNIDTLGPIYKKAYDSFLKVSEDFESEDINSEKGQDLFKKCSKEAGLPYNQEITLTGFKNESYSGFTLVSSDDKYEIPCVFPDGSPDLSLFIDHGAKVTLTGTISKGDKYDFITVSEISTPKEITPEFNSNIEQALSSGLEHPIVHGTVLSVNSLDDIENLFTLLCPDQYEHSAYYFDTVVCVTDDNKDKSVYLGYDPTVWGEIEVGDKIVFEGSFNFIVKNSNEPSFGYMSNVYDIYIFDK